MIRSSALRTSHRNELSVHEFEGCDVPRLDLFVTDRFGGVSRGPFDSLNLASHVGDDVHCVSENRARIARVVGAQASELIIANQVHGSDIVDCDHGEHDATGDILILAHNTKVAAILVADCVPLAIISPSQHRLALVHAGWRGLASGVVTRAVTHLGASDLQAVIGPCVSMEGYQVGPDVAHHFTDVDHALVADSGDRSRLDLALVAHDQLTQAGVSSNNIVVSSNKTDGGETFFSDRAERPCGRFAIVAKWRS